MEKKFSVSRGEQKRNGLCTQTTLARVFCAACLLLPLAPNLLAQDFSYETNSGAITITGYTGSNGVVTIPSMINDLPVTRIKNYAFQECTSLNSVTVPNSITTIERGAFYFCYNLTTVTLPDHLFGIADETFRYCYSLTNLILPETLDYIGEDVFDDCLSLTSITIPSRVEEVDEWFSGCTALTAINVAVSNSVYSSLDGVLFDKSRSTLIQYPPGKAGAYAVPYGVTTLDGSAFQDCTHLTSILLPNSLTSIGNSAFYGCTNLVTLTIPGSVTNIGDLAFAGCSKLTGLYFCGNAPAYFNAAYICSVYFNVCATFYYLPGTTGWDEVVPWWGRRAVWPQVQTSAGSSFGMGMNGFRFNLLAGSNAVIVVEAATNLASPVWLPLGTNTLTNGSAYFSDPGWTNLPRRFYRLRSP